MAIERYNFNGRFHEAVIHNGTLYLSGSVAAGATVTEQATKIFESLDAALTKYGSDKEHVLSGSVYLTDMSTFNEFNAVWNAFFNEGTHPVRTCIGAALANPDYLVEITLVAAIK